MRTRNLKSYLSLIKQGGIRSFLFTHTNSLFCDLIDFKWIVDSDGDPGISIFNERFRIHYYKYSDVFIFNLNAPYREAYKRELNLRNTGRMWDYK